LTFVATANAVSHLGAIPHFVDSEVETLGLDPGKLEEYLKDILVFRSGKPFSRKSGRRIAAVVPVHVFGHPVDMDGLMSVCERLGIAVVEDAAEAFGSYYKDRHVGQWGQTAVLSFNGNKIMTTGGGGVLLTVDHDLADRAKHLTTTAKVPHPWRFYHDEIGYNFRMPNINAALGCAQLEQMPLFLEKKRMLAEAYERELATVEGLSVITEPVDARSNFWLNAVLLDREYSYLRDEIIASAQVEGFLLRPGWEPLHKLDIYADCPRMEDMSMAEDLAARLINLPSGVIL
jgi:perosamine synthetase